MSGETRSVYGLEVGLTRGDGGARTVAAAPERAPAGNAVLRIGQENQRGLNGWHQTEHLVLVPEEAKEYARAILALYGEEEG